MNRTKTYMTKSGVSGVHLWYLCVIHIFGDDITTVAYNSTFLLRTIIFPETLVFDLLMRRAPIFGGVVKYLGDGITFWRETSL